MAAKLTTVVCGLLLTTVCGAGAAPAQEILRDSMPKDIWRTIAQHQKALESLDGSDAAKGVYSTLFVWPPSYPTLRVCFFAGSQELRAKIAEMASAWQKPEIGIRFDFGEPGKLRSCGEGGRDSQIRVGFDKKGYWSQFGQMAVVYGKQDQSSLNLEGFDKKPVDQLTPYELGTVKHEFGHALGFIHEHQSPDSHCDAEYNWDFIYRYLEGPPANWSKDEIDFNMKPWSTAGNDIMLTDFDKTSVMLYHFPAEYYVNGVASRCYVPVPNNEISRVDHAVAEYMYPANRQARIDRFGKNKMAFAAIWNKASNDGGKGVMIDMVKAFFESPGTADQ